MNGIDRHIEGEDRDDEPREPACKECGANMEDEPHDFLCSYHPDYYERPEPEIEPDEVTT